ncbi:MAG: hypothetical protein JJT95_05195 [Pararhodobacter sp.]|nr:hypothetical protein [Pararhodobacter sp.]
MKAVRLSILAAALALPGAAPLGAQTAYERFPIRIETLNSGPGELVSRFRVDSMAEVYYSRYGLSESDPFVQILSRAHPTAQADWLQENIDETVLGSLLDYYGIVSGIGGPIGAAWPGGLWESLASSLGYVGLGLTAGKVAYDVARGETGQAVWTASVGSVGFLIGTYGTPGVQMVALAALVTEFTVRRTGSALLEATHGRRLDASEAAYRRFFELPAHQRGADDWYAVVTRILRNRLSPQEAADALEREIAAYVSRPWDDSYFWEEIVPDTGSRVVGITRFAVITPEQRAEIEARARERINETLNTVVFARAARQMWLDTLDAAAADANTHLRPHLNSLWELTIVAHDIDAPTRFTIRVPGHRGWSGMLEPGVPRVVHISTLAILRANQRSGEIQETQTLVESGPGWLHEPREIELETPQGTLAQLVIWDENRRATVQFGEPEALYVLAYRREEGAQGCTRTWQHPGQPETTETLSLPPHPTGILHMGVGGRLQLIMGQFNDIDGWVERSFGASDGANLHFTPPLFDNITALESCEAQLFLGVLFERARCSVRRIAESEDMVPAPPGRQGLCVYEGTSGMRMVIPCADPPAPALETGGEPLLLRDFEAPPDRVQVTVRQECTAPIRIDLQGGFMRDQGQWFYVSFEGEVGRQMREAIRQGLDMGLGQ